MTPLMVAINQEVVKVLLDAGADINAKDVYGFTPISWAAARGHIEVVRFLLDNGADVKVRDRYGNSVLIGAVKGGHSQIVNLLKAHGASE